MRPALLQPILIVLACVFILLMLSGCVVAPYPEPVVYGPPPPATVVVRPGYGPPHYHRHRPYWRRGWR